MFEVISVGYNGQEQGITERSTLLRQSQGDAYFSNAHAVGCCPT